MYMYMYMYMYIITLSQGQLGSFGLEESRC